LKKNAQILSGLNKKQKGQKKKETALCLHPFSCGENLHAPLFYFGRGWSTLWPLLWTKAPRKRRM